MNAPSLALVATVLVSTVVCSAVVYAARANPLGAGIGGIVLGVPLAIATWMMVGAATAPAVDSNGMAGVFIQLLFMPAAALNLAVALIWPVVLTLVEVSWLVSRRGPRDRVGDW